MVQGNPLSKYPLFANFPASVLCLIYASLSLALLVVSYLLLARPKRSEEHILFSNILHWKAGFSKRKGAIPHNYTEENRYIINYFLEANTFAQVWVRKWLKTKLKQDIWSHSLGTTLCGRAYFRSSPVLPHTFSQFWKVGNFPVQPCCNPSSRVLQQVVAAIRWLFTSL